MKLISALSALALIFSSVPSHAIMYVKPEVGAALAQVSTSGSIDVNGSTISISGSDSGTAFHAGFGLGFREDYVHVLVNPRYYFATIDSASAGLTFIDFGFGIEWAIPIMTSFMISSASSSDSNVLASTGGYRLSVSYFISPNLTASFDMHSFSTEASGLTANLTMYTISVAQAFEFEYPDKWWRGDQAE